jgi:outer membrane immunogenic protein
MVRKILLGFLGVAAFTVPAYAGGYESIKDRPSVFSWSGFYAGINGGYGWTERDDLTITNNVGGSTTPTKGTSPSGPFAGLQAGYNWQRGNLVVGVETDIQVAGVRDSFDRLVGPDLIDAQAGLDYFGTVRGRIGYAWGHTLLYGTGGFAYGGVQDKIVVNGVARPQNSSTETGWVAGGGIEHVFARNWTVKLEYQHLDLGSYKLSAPVLPPNGITVFTSSLEHAYDTVRVGVNYQFH